MEDVVFAFLFYLFRHPAADRVKASTPESRGTRRDGARLTLLDDGVQQTAVVAAGVVLEEGKRGGCARQI